MTTDGAPCAVDAVPIRPEPDQETRDLITIHKDTVDQLRQELYQLTCQHDSNVDALSQSVLHLRDTQAELANTIGELNRTKKDLLSATLEVKRLTNNIPCGATRKRNIS